MENTSMISSLLCNIHIWHFCIVVLTWAVVGIRTVINDFKCKKREEKKVLRTFRLIVCICSSYAGDIEAKGAVARRYSRFAVEKGRIPIAPHLLFPQFLNDSNPAERELGLFFGNAIMSKCSEVWVFGERISNGMTAEIKRARCKNYRLRYFTEELEEKTMFEIKENRRVLSDGTEITTYSRDIISANILEVEAGTTGYNGGDSGGNCEPETMIRALKFITKVLEEEAEEVSD